MDRPHNLNIKEFYKKTISSFFEAPVDPKLGSDWPWVVSNPEIENLKYLKNWDDQYWAGTKRMSYQLYGTTHECLVPMWLDQCDGLKFLVHLDAGQHRLLTFELDLSRFYQESLSSRNLKQTFHNDFVDYFMEYLDFINVTKGNYDVMSIDFKNNICLVTGLQPESGNMIVRQNFNVTRNLIFRERPLLESNSLITNTFRDMKVICPHLINFNLCFDLDELCTSPTVKDLVESTPNLRVSTGVMALRKYADVTDNSEYFSPDHINDSSFEIGGTRYIWQDVEVRDLYTNHDYIPKPQVWPERTDGKGVTYEDYSEDDHINALKYLGDYNDVSMMHQNKITQPICHWVHADDPDGDLFNVYDGFGAYIKDANENITEYPHGFGTTPDPADSTYDESLDNTIWAGAPRIGDGDDVENTLNAPQHWIENGYLKDASGFISGLRFDYSPTDVAYHKTAARVAPRKVYIGTMTTPWENESEAWKSMQTSHMTSQHYIMILGERITSRGGSDLPKTQQEQASDFDKQHDWHKYSDMDNRWHVLTNVKHHAIYIDPTGENIPKGEYALGTEINGKDSDECVYTAPDGSAKIITVAYPITRIGGTSPMDTSPRDADNVAALAVCMRRIPSEDKQHRPDDPLSVIFWYPRTKKKAFSTSNGIVYKDIFPHLLTLGGVIEAVNKYINKYKPMWEALKKAVGDGIVDPGDLSQLPDMDDFEVVHSALNHIQAPDVIYFNKSITARPNVAVSAKASETDYYKLSNVNTYVLRYSDKIKPAMFPCLLKDRGAKPMWGTLFGRNFLYQKRMVWPYQGCFPTDLGAYLHTSVPPRYPSLNYETISPVIITNPQQQVPKGDIMYSEPHPIYMGMNTAGQELSLKDITLGSIGSEVLINDIYTTLNMELSSLGASATGYLNTSAEDRAAYEKLSTEERISYIKGLSVISTYKHLKKEHAAIVDNWLISKDLMQVFKNLGDYDTWRWFEYKWFDMSTAVLMPKRLQYEIAVHTNDRSSLELAALQAMTTRADLDGNKLATFSFGGDKQYKFDYPYLRQIYNFTYNLKGIEMINDSIAHYIATTAPIVAADPNITGPVIYEPNKISALTRPSRIKAAPNRDYPLGSGDVGLSDMIDWTYEEGTKIAIGDRTAQKMDNTYVDLLTGEVLYVYTYEIIATLK